MIYSDEMAIHTGEETDWTAATTGAKYSPLVNGRLVQLKLFFGQTAVTSVITVASARVESPSFGGVTGQVTLEGPGLLTAPAFVTRGGIQNVDLPVKTGVPIAVSFKHLTGAITPVTSNLKLVGVFES